MFLLQRPKVSTSPLAVKAREARLSSSKQKDRTATRPSTLRCLISGLERVRRRLPSLVSNHDSSTATTAAAKAEVGGASAGASSEEDVMRAPRATPEDSAIDTTCCSPESLTLAQEMSCEAEACVEPTADVTQLQNHVNGTCGESPVDRLLSDEKAFSGFEVNSNQHQPVSVESEDARTFSNGNSRNLARIPLQLPLVVSHRDDSFDDVTCDTEPLLSVTSRPHTVDAPRTRKFSHVDAHALDMFFSPEDDDDDVTNEQRYAGGANAVFHWPRVGLDTPTAAPADTAPSAAREHHTKQLRFDSLDSNETDCVTSSLSLCTTVTDSASTAPCRRVTLPEVLIDDVTLPRRALLDTSLRLGP